MVGFKKSEPIPETKVLEAIRNSATLQRCAGRKDVKVVNECPLLAESGRSQLEPGGCLERLGVESQTLHQVGARRWRKRR